MEGGHAQRGRAIRYFEDVSVTTVGLRPPCNAGTDQCGRKHITNKTLGNKFARVANGGRKAALESNDIANARRFCTRGQLYGFARSAV
jgi:hypothetical protein